MGAKTSKQCTSNNPPAYEQLPCDNSKDTIKLNRGLDNSPPLKKTKYEVPPTVILDPSLIFVNTEPLTEEPIKVSQLYEQMGDFYKEQNNAYKAEYNRLCKTHICSINSKLKKDAWDGVDVAFYMPDDLTKSNKLQIPEKYLSKELNKQLLNAVWAFVKNSYSEYIITDEIHESWRIRAKIHVPNCHNFDAVSK